MAPLPELLAPAGCWESLRAAVANGADAVYFGVDRFNARLRDELLNGEIFYSLREAQIIIESWRQHFNAVRPHQSLRYRPPAPEVLVPAIAAWPSAQPRPAPTATQDLVGEPEMN